MFVNAVAESLTGWTQQEAEGKPLVELFDIVNAETRRPNDWDRLAQHTADLEASCFGLLARSNDTRDRGVFTRMGEQKRWQDTKPNARQPSASGLRSAFASQETTRPFASEHRSAPSASAIAGGGVLEPQPLKWPLYKSALRHYAC
jgi:hypothetical protein